MKRWLTDEVEVHKLEVALNAIELSGATVFAIVDGTSSRKDRVIVVAHIEPGRASDDVNGPQIHPLPPAVRDNNAPASAPTTASKSKPKKGRSK